MQDKEKIIINDHIQDDPLSEENLDKTLNYLHKIRLSLPQKNIWYTVVTNINTSLGAHLVVFQKRDITTTSVEKL